MPKKMKSAEDLMELARGFMSARAFLTAHELGLFAVLANGPRASDYVARAVKADARATDRLLNACVALGLLTKKKSRFALTPLAARHLIPGLPGYMGGLDHTLKMWNTWGTLTEAVRKGGSVALKPMPRRSSEWFRPFIAAMHAFASPKAPKVVKKLDLRKTTRVLDVGGGSGAYAMAFAQAKEGLRATVFDLPQVIRLTRGYVEEAGLLPRIDVVPGDFEKDPLPRGFDLVLVSAIIHMLPPAGIQALFRKCAKALEPGGQLVVREFIMDPDRTAPEWGALFALNMLVATKAGDTYTAREIGSWMKRTGFSAPRRIETGDGHSMMVGRKKRKR